MQCDQYFHELELTFTVQDNIQLLYASGNNILQEGDNLRKSLASLLQKLKEIHF